MLQRTVCVKFDDDLADDERTACMDDFRQVATALPMVKSYQAGLAMPDDFGREAEYDAVHTMTLDDMDAVTAMVDHADWQAFVARHEEEWVEMLVVNVTLESAP